jgi:hypothetical protein
MYESIAHRKKLSVDVNKFLAEQHAMKRASLKGPVHLARNLYIHDKVHFWGGVSDPLSLSSSALHFFLSFFSCPSPCQLG